MNSNNPPKVSILSAVYNESAHIQEMIDSVVDQDYPFWEIIFVDDGSNDDTKDLIAAAAAKDSRIHVIPTRGKVGKVRAFNLAFSQSEGEIIALLAGDDRIPPGSLAVRAANHPPTGGDGQEPPLRLSRYRLRTFSNDPKFDGLTLPRRGGASTSGGVITMDRALATILFPIPEILPSEDTWLGYAAPRIARHVTDSLDVVLEYRIHGGNSNPRAARFEEMSSKIGLRHQAWKLLADSELPFNESDRRELRILSQAEEYRRHGDWLKIIRSTQLPLPTRLALASMSHPALHAVRTRFYGILSGWRSQ